MRGKLQQHFKTLARTIQRPWGRKGIFFAITFCLAVVGIVAAITNGPQWQIAFTVLPMIISIAIFLFPAPSQKASSESVEDQKRKGLLTAVRRCWITGERAPLEQSFLYKTAPLILELQREQDLIPDDPWRDVRNSVASSPSPILSGTRITQLYKENEEYQRLLILGKPGSGKTTMLLELVKFLLDCAEQDNDQPIPVLFLLSEWAKNRLSLSEWFIEELDTKYRIPSSDGREWVEQGKIIPLLDGLDEVGSDALPECIKQVNVYKRKFYYRPIVVSCRYEDYKNHSGTRLDLDQTIVVQPLSRQQVDNYLKDLSRAGCQLETLREALDQHVDLYELTRTPLSLSVLAETYEKMPIQDLIALPASKRQQHVYEKYVDRMLTRRGPNDPNYQLVFGSTNPRRIVSLRRTQFKRQQIIDRNKQQTIDWLSWLATEMENHNQTVVYLERLQPSWLPKDLPHRGFDHGLTFRLVREMAYEVFYDIVGFLVVGLVFEGLTLLFGGTPFGDGIVASVLNLLIVAGVTGLVALLCSLGLNILSTGEIHPAEVTRWDWGNMRLHLIESARAGIAVLPIIGGYTGLVLITWVIASSLKIDLQNWGNLMYYVLILGSLVLVACIPCFLFKPLSSIFERSFDIIDTIIANNKLARNYGLLGGGLGLLIGMANRSIGMLAGGLGFGLAGVFFGGMLNGLSSGLKSNEVVNLNTLKKPNEGIQRSVRNSFIVGGVSFLLGGMLFGLVWRLLLRLSKDMNNNMSAVLLSSIVVGILFGFICGLSLALQHGGWACIKHSVLRLRLRKAGCMPRNYVRFLDYAANCLLLNKVGGGYEFKHEKLRTYFIDLNIWPRRSRDKMSLIRTSSSSQGTVLWNSLHHSVVNIIAWSPDSTRIAFGGGNTINVLEVPSQKTIVAYHQEYPSVYTFSWSPDGKQIVSIGYDKIHRWDAASGAMLAIYQGYARRVAWSPDGTCIAAGSKTAVNKAELGIYDVATGKYTSIGRWNIGWPLVGVASIDWSPDGAFIASCDWSNTITIRDAKNGDILVEYTCPTKSKTAKWSPDGNRVASIHNDNTIHIWDAHTGKTLEIFDWHTTFPQALAWSPDGTQMVSGDHQDIFIWDTDTGWTLFEAIVPNGVSALAWAPDGKYIASGSSDKKISIWQAN